jgi:hypothetical protein
MAATLTEPSAVGIGHDLVETEARLRNFDEAHMVRWLNALSDEEARYIHRNRFQPLYLNLLSVFRKELAPERIRDIAVACTKSSIWSNSAVERYLATFPAPDREFEFRLRGWKPELIRELLAPGKGLIVCSFRIGLYQFIPLELAAMGFPVWCPLVDAKFRSFSAATRRLAEATASSDWLDAESAEQLRKLSSWRVLDAAAQDTTLNVAKALKRGEVVMIYIDANNGVDGPWGDSSRMEVPFFGEPVSVKSGVARLACFSGAPLLPVIAPKRDIADGAVIFEEPLIPGERLTAGGREQFAGDAMRRLYELLESYGRRYPDQWDGAATVHRWRRSAPPPVEMDAAALAGRSEQIGRDIENGSRYKMAGDGSVAVLPDGAGEIWVDIASMRSFRAPAWAGDLMRTLSSGPGVDLKWLAAQAAGEQQRSAVLALLAQIEKRGLIGAARDLDFCKPAWPASA